MDLKFPSGFHGQTNMHTWNIGAHTALKTPCTHTQHKHTNMCAKMLNCNWNVFTIWVIYLIPCLKREKESVIYLFFTAPVGSLQFAS